MKLVSRQQGFLKAQVPKERWVVGSIQTAAGSIPQIKTTLDWKDRLGAYQVRWGMNRMGYKVAPGLYAVGKPGPKSPVLVSANYKLTFDRVRKNLSGLDVWLLILDTRGVNVWCAAGKGTFGTKELVNRIKKTALEKVVSHRQLILPQLGAVGVSAGETARESGFKVVYGPVRIEDIKEYLHGGCQKTSHMRRVTFTLGERLAVVPMEIVGSWKIILGVIVLSLILAWNQGGINLAALAGELALGLGSVITGAVLVPILLPLLPFRSFALKGLVAGGIWVAVYGRYFLGLTYLALFFNFLLFVPLCAYLAVNFTGASTYTSLSGVQKELRIALPMMIVSAILGLLLRLLMFFRVF